MTVTLILQDREGEDGAGPYPQHDGGGATAGVPGQPQAGHQQGAQGKVQVPAEVLPQRSVLCRKFFIYHLYYYIIFFHFIHFIIPFGKFGLPYLGTAAARAALPSPTSVCWVFLCFRNPPNSDMDYRIFNMHS